MYFHHMPSNIQWLSLVPKCMLGWCVQVLHRVLIWIVGGFFKIMRMHLARCCNFDAKGKPVATGWCNYTIKQIVFVLLSYCRWLTTGCLAASCQHISNLHMVQWITERLSVYQWGIALHTQTGYTEECCCNGKQLWCWTSVNWNLQNI